MSLNSDANLKCIAQRLLTLIEQGSPSLPVTLLSNLSLGSIDSTDVPETILSANPDRKYIEIFNTSPAGSFAIAFGVDADLSASAYIIIPAGGSWYSSNVCPPEYVSICGEASDKFSILTF